ncbi:MAG: hypothetical protein KAT35_04325 [Candidatus Aenigmarchaeota archaeon]|nr:hypothetical protein [Candidatus Aenigmarchaeota archaeon]
MTSKVVKRKKPVPDSGQQAPELERKIKKVSNQLAGARIKEESERAAELEWELNDLLKQRKEVLASTPVRREEGLNISSQETVGAALENGNLSYSQGRPPMLTEEQVERVPNDRIRVRYSA